MNHQPDAIVDIKESQITYFGGSGKMLLPSRTTIESVLRTIPASQIITTDLLRKHLAHQFGVQGTCPVTTKKALITIANDMPADVPYWRVVKQSGELIAYFPGGIHGQSALLRDEGFTIESKGKTAKVKNYRASLVHLD